MNRTLWAVVFSFLLFLNTLSFISNLQSGSYGWAICSFIAGAWMFWSLIRLDDIDSDED